MTGTVTTRDVLDGDWNPNTWWTTTNLGEAAPGVITPLCWSLWGPASERAVRGAFAAVGALENSQVRVPADPERMIAVFHGRVACSVDFLGRMGDRMPGTSGAAIAEQMLGELPAGFRSVASHRRVPIVAVKFPHTFLSVPSKLRALQSTTHAWWSEELARTPSLTLDGARQQWIRAADRFDEATRLHALSVFAGVQPVYEALTRLAAGVGDVELIDRLLAGQGSHAELRMVEDLWAISRGTSTVEQFMAEHGYHGTGAGELSSTVWREDPSSVRAMVEQYRLKGGEDSPTAVHARQSEARREAEHELLDKVGAVKRPVAKLVLSLASRYVPLRGVGKAAYLQTLDIARSSARRIGEYLGLEPDGAFLLTCGELLSAEPGRVLDELLAVRRQQRACHEEIAIPSGWRGRPVPLQSFKQQGSGSILTGLGVSRGVVEGPVRVVTDPSFAEVESGEVLVATTTDPSWASIMFVASALVVDVGGQLSHAAVVARELGVPCVMGIGDAVARLNTGDIVRVDGHAGTVAIVKRVGRP